MLTFADVTCAEVRSERYHKARRIQPVRRCEVRVYQNIQAKCKESETTVSRLESELGFPRGSICKWDRNIPSIAKVKAVADRLEVTIDELLKGVEFDK